MNREVNGQRAHQKIGFRNELQRQIYDVTRIKKEFIYDADMNLNFDESDLKLHLRNHNHSNFHGGIFNLSFSPNGSILVGATERNALLFFDPLNHRLFQTVREAHSGSVNYVKFLDENMFASCSDDRNVALWDMRMLSSRLKLLEGHMYWVKNIEYDSSRRLLVTSSYDGSVITWDIFKDNHNDSFSRRGPNEGDQYGNQDSTPHKQILHLSCIMRTRLSNDLSKMFICTSEGYILVIHDLNLETIYEDLKEFQSDLYRLMQKGHTCGFDFGSWCNHLFTAKRNRVELISDFPKEDEAHSITSLDIHPQNWSILSRNITRNDSSEWTCLHDIQDDLQPSSLVPIELPKENVVHTYDAPRATRHMRYSVVSNDSSASGASTSASTAPPEEIHVSPVVIISSRTPNQRAHATILNPYTSYRQITSNGPIPNIYQNVDRVTHYLQELNVGPGYIKELCFSPDGRVICSPYEFGYRILGFDTSCSELSETHPVLGEPKPLVELKRLLPHGNYVVTTRFSPTTPLIASGCLSGRIVFSQPVL